MSNIELFSQCTRMLKLVTYCASRELHALDIGTLQAGIVRFIDRTPGCSASDLSRACLTDPAAVGRALDALVKKRWVRRKEHPKDRRLWILELTAAGRKQLPALDRARDRLADRLTQDLSQTEKRRLGVTLGKLICSLEQHAGPERNNS